MTNTKLINFSTNYKKQKKRIKNKMNNLSTIEKCIMRDLIKNEIKSLSVIDYGKYKYDLFEYVEKLLKIGKKISLDNQQKIKAKKMYGRVK